MERINTNVCPFLADVPNYEIVDGNMHITAGDFCLAMSLRNFQMGMERARRVIEAWERSRAEIIFLEMRKADHAARS